MSARADEFRPSGNLRPGGDVRVGSGVFFWAGPARLNTKERTMFERTMSVCAVLLLVACPIIAACTERTDDRTAVVSNDHPATIPNTEKEPKTMVQTDKVVKTDAEWRKILTPEQYEIMRNKGTERAFTGKYWDTTTPGVYKCAACGAVLFSSDNKFDSHCGWPSFDRMIEAGTVIEREDDSHGMHRTEVICARCGGHLGHVFDDGPTDTHMRYCINSASIELDPKADPKGKDKTDAKP
jgi:methionine-R-sulfoxide reductase